MKVTSPPAILTTPPEQINFRDNGPESSHEVRSHVDVYTWYIYDAPQTGRPWWVELNSLLNLS